SNEPIAIVMGDLRGAREPLVRLHSSCFTGDLLDSLRCDCGDQLHMALAMIADEGAGALIYLPQEGRGVGLIEKIRAYNLQDTGLDTVQANVALGYRADTRDYGIGLQILKDLGLSRVRLLTNNPKKTDAFVYYGYELTVVDQVPIVAPEIAERRRYLDTKRASRGHPFRVTTCGGAARPVDGGLSANKSDKSQSGWNPRAGARASASRFGSTAQDVQAYNVRLSSGPTKGTAI